MKAGFQSLFPYPDSKSRYGAFFPGHFGFTSALFFMLFFFVKVILNEKKEHSLFIWPLFGTSMSLFSCLYFFTKVTLLRNVPERRRRGLILGLALASLRVRVLLNYAPRFG